MKELKFRVWDGEEMIYNARVGGFDETRPTVWFEDEWVNVEPLSYNEIMQYTDLKDKNGKEIFEGDILKSGKRNWEVVFGGGSFMMSWANGTAQLFINEMVEIIGNIYENPELLTDKQ